MSNYKEFENRLTNNPHFQLWNAKSCEIGSRYVRMIKKYLDHRADYAFGIFLAIGFKMAVFLKSMSLYDEIQLKLFIYSR